MARAEVETFFREHQDLVVAEIRKRLHAQVLAKAPRGEQAEWFAENRIPFGKMKVLTYWGFLASRAWDAAEVAQMEPGKEEKEKAWMRVQELLGCMMLFVEATALGGGMDYTMGWLLTAEQDLPWENLLDGPRGEANLKGLPAMPKLAHPAWLSTQIGFTSDLDKYQERLEKVKRNQKGQQQPYNPKKQDGADPKAGAPGKGKGEIPK